MFYGLSNLGKTTLAEKFAAELLQTPGLAEHSCEFYPLKSLPDKKDISIEQVREWRRSLLLKTFSAGYKVGIIYKAEELNQESANALLKIVEEPAPKTVVVIITVNKQQMLPTITSRCQCLKFLPVAEKDLASGYKENSAAAHTGGSFAGKTRQDFENLTGKKVVSGENFLPPKQENKKLK